MKKTKVTIVDDHKIFAEGLADILTNASSFEVMNVITSLDHIIPRIKADQADLILLDLNVQGKKSIPFIHSIKSTNPKIIILMLSMYDEPVFISESRKNGANGYILKDAGRFELLEAIEKSITNPFEFIYKGKIRATTENAQNFVQDNFMKKMAITKRELEIIQLISEDKTSTEIADLLFLSKETVKTHIRNVRAKLNVRSRAGLIKFYLEFLNT